MNTPYDYIARGWHIFPCHSIRGGRCTCNAPDCGANAGKHPRTLHGVNDASVDPRMIEQWERMWGSDGINWALACGESSGVLAVDIDPRHGGDEAITAWQHENGALPTTLINLTGGGGFHLLFAYPTGYTLGNRTNILPGVDVRSNGGYIMLPPSWHQSGRQFAWRDPNTYPVELPETLRGLIAAPRGTPDRPALVQLDAIPEGQRNETLFRKACSLRRLLHDDRLSVEASVRAYNLYICQPPLPEDEIEKIIDSAFKQDHDDVFAWDIGNGDLRSMTDDGNALRLVDYHGDDLRYSEGMGWWRWGGFRWEHDSESQVVQQRAREIHLRISDESETLEDRIDANRLMRWATQSQSAGKISAMMKLATSDVRVLRSLDEFDRDPFVLGCLNGVLDLRTGQLRPHDRDDLITKSTNIEYEAGYRLQEWEDFINSTCEGDIELVEYLRRAVGYTLTGSTSEDAFFIITGPPASGKSTFIEGVQAALGDYAGQIATETILLHGQPNRRDIDLANAFGRRLVSTLEIGEGDRLAESTVKQLTGGDRITARLLYKNAFSYRPQFKLWIATNHVPNINDQATWRRIKRIPFDRHLPASERDPRVKDIIRDPSLGGKAVLAWAVQGCQEWLRMGLAQPQRITLEVHEYHADQDRLADFIAENLEQVEGAMTDMVEVYASYTRWTLSIGERPIRRQSFTAQIKERRYQTMRDPRSGKLYLVNARIKQATAQAGILTEQRPWS